MEAPTSRCQARAPERALATEGRKGLVQARRVMGDIVGGGGEVVEPPLAHVGDVLGGVPLAVAPGPGGEGGVPEGHEVPVFVIRVPC